MADNVNYDDPIYRQALANTLNTTDPSADLHDLKLKNHLYIPIGYTPVGTDGRHGLTRTLNNNESSDSQDYKSNLHVYHIITNALTGAFLAVFKLAKNTSYDPGKDGHYDFLFQPNTIGVPPVANNLIPIPANSWSVVVGISDKIKTSDGEDAVVVREQSWNMSGTSYSLAPGETKQITVSHEFGRESTTSDSNTMASSVGTSVSGGWGPISAKISASLSATSSCSHDVSIRESESSSQVETLENKYDTSLMVYFWKLMDTVTIYKLDNDTATEALGSVSIPVGPMFPLAYTISGKKVSLFDAQKLQPISQVVGEQATSG